MKKILAAWGIASAIALAAVTTAPAATAQVPPPDPAPCKIKVTNSNRSGDSYHVTFSQTCGYQVKAYYHTTRAFGTNWDYGNVRTTAGTSTIKKVFNSTFCSSGYEWNDYGNWRQVALQSGSGCK